MQVKYLTKVEKVEEFTEEEKSLYAPIAEKFAFRTNNYYNSLINWSDPNDPLKRLVIPVKEELDNWGELDASSERLYQPVPGVEHKYRSTALLLCNDVCAAYCRFCFRKRLFQNDNDEVVKDVSEGVEYIRNHPEINNVLLTGGDPLVMSTGRLEKIIAQVCQIDHVRIIRIGSKIPAFNPYRVVDDPTLPAMLRKYGAVKQIYLMAHFNHAVELTEPALRCLKSIQDAGVTIVNQTPIIRGVNDSAAVLKELFEKLSFAGIPPYYVFACRPTEGNKAFAVPIETAFRLYEEARMNCSGLAKTARFIMSHKTGKMEVIGMTDDLILMKYLNVVDASKNGRVIMFPRNPEAYWFDDYTDVPEPVYQAVL
jgi:KamA family protein